MARNRGEKRERDKEGNNKGQESGEGGRRRRRRCGERDEECERVRTQVELKSGVFASCAGAGFGSRDMT